MQRMTRRTLLQGAAAAPLLATSASAADYPDRPIRVVIPYTAGGVAENIMRLLASSMEQRLGQKLVFEAKPGAAGNIGTGEVARATPDGYTLLVAATNNYVINQFVIKMTFDPMATLAPVAKVAEVPLVLFTNPEVPAKTLGEFIAYARANPGKANYGIPSLGTVNHLLMERLKQTTGAEITRVPYRGSPEATLALLKNDIQLFPIGLAAVGSHFREGRLRALAVATETRIPMLPDVPTMAEFGFPGFVASNWWGMAAPAGTPDAVLDTLAQAVAEAQRTALVKERFTALGMLVPDLSRSTFAASLRSEAAQMAGHGPARPDRHRVSRRRPSPARIGPRTTRVLTTQEASEPLPPSAPPAISARSGLPPNRRGLSERAGGAAYRPSRLEDQVPLQASPRRAGPEPSSRSHGFAPACRSSGSCCRSAGPSARASGTPFQPPSHRFWRVHGHCHRVRAVARRFCQAAR